jgi:hypothetical protein
MLEESKAIQDSPNYNAKKIDFPKQNTKAISEVAKLLGIRTSYE